MYYFNSALWQNLHKLMGMTMKDYMRDFLDKNNQYMRFNTCGEKLMVRDLLKLCNNAHIPLVHFITTDGVDFYLNERSHYVMPVHLFKPIRFRFENFRKVYGEKSITGLQRKDFSEVTGISEQSLYLFRKPKTFTMRIGVLLDVCNRLNIPLSYFIDDVNVPLPGNAPDNKDESIKSLRTEVSELKNQIARLNAERRQSVLYDSHTGTGLAAETEVEYHSANHSGNPRPWVFNHALLDSMPEKSGLSPQNFYREIGYKMKNNSEMMARGNILTVNLIRLCNRFGISSRYFFLREGDGSVMEESARKTVGVLSRIVTFHPSRIREAMGVCSMSGLTVKDAIDRMEASPFLIKAWSRKESTLRVDELAKLCTILGVSPWAFIDDTNPGPAHHVTYSEALLEENRELRKELVKLKREVVKNKG